MSGFDIAGVFPFLLIMAVAAIAFFNRYRIGGVIQKSPLDSWFPRQKD